MQSQAVRQAFLDFFRARQHEIVPSAPIVVKNDPTLMFTNAGMNPFKDIFLGNRSAASPRVADTQKCLRVSGKHNDLEEVGVDTYHHTMFEMLGNWSFGDYFKPEAIQWAWEFLTGEMGIDPERMYATVFQGDSQDGLGADTEAEELWKRHLPAERILRCSKKDNFWEMGETGPCGPCSEIHVDMRSEEERQAKPGVELVNQDHPQVIEIWNLVFIQYQRTSDNKLHELPNKHVDTGMGFERLCMVLQGVGSSYDSDIFRPLIKWLEARSGISYGKDEQTDIALRVISDHIRAVAFTIADGQLPGSTGAGYVVRRILRRAIRYGYSFLGLQEPFFHGLLDPLTEQLGATFPELKEQSVLIAKVVLEEENSFLRTLSSGLKRLDGIVDKLEGVEVNGRDVFELYDTYGFPFDLTQLVLAERGLTTSEAAFQQEMEAQKARSRDAAASETGDWTVVHEADGVRFLGYDSLEATAKVVCHREVKQKKKTVYHLVLDKTPFYAESGGQVGDRGSLTIDGEEIVVYDTKKENDLFIHFVNKLPANPKAEVKAQVNAKSRRSTEANHSATHLLHAALREVLGDHVQQKGSHVGPDRLRFDFAHFSKVTAEELAAVEKRVNTRIRDNIQRLEERAVPIEEATSRGAMALFGEKYGDTVRVITFDPEYSIELCGGTHVQHSGEIGFFRILTETAVAAGVRRIEAITGLESEQWINDQVAQLDEIKELLKSPDAVTGLRKLQEDNQQLQAKLEQLGKAQLQQTRVDLLSAVTEEGGVKWISGLVEVPDADGLKQISFDLKRETDRLALVLGAEVGGKALLSVMLSEELVEEKGWNAGQIIRQAAREIQGGGGGQPFYATAGGKNPSGLRAAVDAAVSLLKES